MPDSSEILNARLGYGLSRAQFAERLGVNRATVWYWESGHSRMSATTWAAIRAGCLAVSEPSGDLMRRARRIAHLTQRQAATLIETPQRHWQDCESGRVRMPALKWALFLQRARLPANFTVDYDPMRSTRGLYR